MIAIAVRVRCKSSALPFLSLAFVLLLSCQFSSRFLFALRNGSAHVGVAMTSQDRCGKVTRQQIRGRGLEDIQRGHKKFRAMKGGPLKTLSVKQGAMKT